MLLAVEHSGFTKRGAAMWLCKCNCGREKRISGATLRNGRSQSCGCRNGAGAPKHGHTCKRAKYMSPTYHTWCGMKQRCDNPNAFAYEYYGGRGISYPAKWKAFVGFLEDMGERPEGMTLDRIDNDAGYSKENCRWATKAEQGANKRNTIFVQDEEERLSLRAYARKHKTRPETVKKRFGV